MSATVLVGTVDGLYEVAEDSPAEVISGRKVTALARNHKRDGWLALLDGDALWDTSGDDGHWQELASIARWPATCLADGGAGLLVGTAEAHLLRLADGDAEPLAGFEETEDRESWYTPWGGPPDTRSISLAGDTVYVNVHVGGIVRSRDGGTTWAPTIDIDADVHQVLAVESPSLLLAPGAYGLSVSEDGGATWRLETDGLHARYLRAVTVAGDVVLVSASSGPGGGQSAVYRRGSSENQFERCTRGLPEWFSGNIDTGCLAADGHSVALGAPDGSVYRSDDAGRSWARIASGLPQVTAVGI